MRAVRVTVRGMFDRLTEQQTAELVAAQDEHTLGTAAYTQEGYLVYEVPGRPGFSFRFAEQAPDRAGVAAAAERAEVKALAWMAERGYPVKNVTVQAVDMSEAPLGKRGRREAARRGG